MKKTPTALAREVKSKREGEYSLRSFAERLGVSHTYLSFWEAGKITKDPSFELISKMEKLLGLKENDLRKISNTGLTKMAHEFFLKNSDAAKEVRSFFEKGCQEPLPANSWKHIISYWADKGRNNSKT